MRLHEFQAKAIFRDYGIPVPEGQGAASPNEVCEIARSVAFPVVVKAQVHAGGRGKAGGVKIVETIEEAAAAAESILGMEIGGRRVRSVLVERAVDIEKEIYLGITVDRGAKAPAMIASAFGGIDIEEVARETPGKVLKETIDPLLGLQDYQVRRLARGLELDRGISSSFSGIARTLQRIFLQNDASLVEINPLVLTKAHTLVACDAKMILDDNALYRHKPIEALRDREEEEPLETEARENRLSYVRLEGRVGCIVNGAGLAMATMDLAKLYGGEPANFLDVGGSAKEEQVVAALRIILSDRNVRAVLINIFGGIVRCDRVAGGILKTLEKGEVKVPIVVRLSGTNEEEAVEMLRGKPVWLFPTMEAAAKKAVELSRGG